MIKRTSMDKIMDLIEKSQSNKAITLDGMRMAALIKNNKYIIIFNTKFDKSKKQIPSSDPYVNFINGIEQTDGIELFLKKYVKSQFNICNF